MKKRMLITTIVMMLVLAVALTTSSLAWFSAANATVTANQGTFSASTGSSVVSLAISHYNNREWSDTLTLNNLDNMAPLAMVNGYVANKLGAEGAKISELLASNEAAFNSAVVQTVGTNADTFVIDETNTITTKKLSDVKADTFYVSNREVSTPVASMNISAQVTLPTKSNTLVVLLTATKILDTQSEDSVVIDESGALAGYVFLVITNVSGKTGFTYYTFTAEDNGKATSTLKTQVYTDSVKLATSATTLDNVLQLSNLGLVGTDTAATQSGVCRTVRFDVFAWYDGADLTNATASASAKVGFTITGA